MFKLTKQERRDTYTGRLKWASELLDEINPEGNRVGVEVGLWKADFAQLMLLHNDRLKWIGIDPYFEYGRGKRKQQEWDEIYDRVSKKMAPFGKRFRMIRLPSHDGVKKLWKKVDFIFIDGNHNTDFVYKDLELYEKRVKSGGILSGHDYSHKSVSTAVLSYAEKHKRDFRIETDFDPYGVFWWRVP